VAAVLTPQSQETRRQALEAAIRGEADYDMEYGLTDGRILQVRGRLFRGRGGRPLKLAGVILDVTDRHRAFADLADSSRRQQLLMNELNHRVKNTFATIQGIAAATARQHPDVAGFVPSFEGRLIALSDTHNLLTAQGWEAAALRDLLEQQFAPHPRDQVTLDGPALDLGPRAALAIGMVLHELATNAVKYGALGVAEGRVEVAWTVDPAGRASLVWTERGGPPVKAPTRTGFGSRLIRSSLAGLEGSADLAYAPEGFVARLTFDPKA
jgi:two-component sensor histidine kinase